MFVLVSWKSTYFYRKHVIKYTLSSLFVFGYVSKDTVIVLKVF